MKSTWVFLLFLVAACQQTPAPAPPNESTERTPSPEGASVYFVEPADNARLEAGEIKVIFGLSGMGIAPAGADFPDTGHHHLLINVEDLPPADSPVPSDSSHLHFGKGQTETTLGLEPGTYKMQLVFGDWLHIPHDPPVVSEPITIFVE